jgi:prephenate dehydrogenase
LVFPSSRGTAKFVKAMITSLLGHICANHINLAVARSLNHIASYVSSSFGPTTRVARVAWLPWAQVIVHAVSSGRDLVTLLVPDTRCHRTLLAFA